MIAVRDTKLPGVVELFPKRHEDERGFFSETYNAAELSRHGISTRFIQDNHSLSRQRGVIRGLHYQLPPFAQAKLVRVVRGRVLDVAVDIRVGSPTYAQWIAVEISAEKWNQLFIPEGFAHGFVTLEPDSELLYKVSSQYSPDHDRAIRHDDRQIGVDWQLDDLEPLVSQRDAQAPSLAEADNPFEYRADE